ncbi:type VI secretion protein, partial [Pseudomonas coronafaciens]
MRFSFFRRLPLLLLSLLAGCSVLSPYSKQTRLDISVIADNQLNPDINGRPSPVVIKLLELKRPTTAESMDFFSLYQRTEDVLANDLAASEIVELRP